MENLSFAGLVFAIACGVGAVLYAFINRGWIRSESW